MRKVFRHLRRWFCNHNLGLSTIGRASITKGHLVFPAVEIRCSLCDEFWVTELDGSDAVSARMESK